MCTTKIDLLGLAETLQSQCRYIFMHAVKTCEECPLYDVYEQRCKLRGTTPTDWKLNYGAEATANVFHIPTVSVATGKRYGAARQSKAV